MNNIIEPTFISYDEWKVNVIHFCKEHNLKYNNHICDKCNGRGYITSYPGDMTELSTKTQCTECLGSGIDTEYGGIMLDKSSYEKQVNDDMNKWITYMRSINK